MDFNRYFTNQELTQLLTQWADTYPSILALRQLGTSQEGTDIHLLVITREHIASLAAMTEAGRVSSATKARKAANFFMIIPLN